MSGWGEWLLGIDRLSPMAENVHFGFERPLPAWAWAGVAGLALALALWSYARLTGSAVARVFLALLRAGLLVALVFLIAGPELVQREESIERDWVIVLADRSASMTIADADGPAEGRRITRDAELKDAIGRSLPMWRSLAESRKVVWLGFDAGAYDLRADGLSEVEQGSAAGGMGAVDLGQPTGRRTSLGAALDQGLRRAAARPLAGVVIFSDGRSMDEPGRAAIRRLQAERIPVHVVPLGSEKAVGDLAIRRAEGPGMAFVNDSAPVTVDLEQLGAESLGLGGVVRLIDADTGLVLDERRIEPGRAEQTITLTTRPQDAGKSTWVVEIEPAGEDLIVGNNRAEVEIELVDRPLRTLYVDGYPRWEQRYLRNLFIREQSITSSNLLLSPRLKSSQEGDVDLDALPDSAQGWGAFDVVVMGDVSSEVFTKSQLEQLREHIATRGGGLLWIGGPGFTPEAWWSTPLADLLPFTRDAARSGPSTDPAVLRPSALAERFGVMRLGGSSESLWPAELSDPSVGWSQIKWRQRIDAGGLKPTAEVLATATPSDMVGTGSAAETGDPLVISMRYGAGRVVYVATDEIWRWRYGRGEALFERFWLQLVRFLARESLSRAGQAATLTVEPRQALVEQPVRVAVELLDQSLVELGLPSVAVTLTRKPAPGDDGPLSVVELVLRPESRESRTYAATWLPTEAGEWSAVAGETALAGADLRAEAVVAQPDDELRRPESDHQLLARLADETGGKVFTLDTLPLLPADLPNRAERLVNETSEPLWDTPLALILVMLLLTLEWMGRRLLKLT